MAIEPAASKNGYAISAINAALFVLCCSCWSLSVHRIIDDTAATMSIMILTSWQDAFSPNQTNAIIMVTGGAKLHTIPTIETGKYLIDMNAITSEAPPYMHLKIRLGRLGLSIPSHNSFFALILILSISIKNAIKPRANVIYHTSSVGFVSKSALAT